MTMVVHGLDVSYFTGKLEGYLRLKGLSYRLELVDTTQFIALGDAVGVRQMPHLALADGRLLTDTVAIIDLLEGDHLMVEGCPSLTPVDPVTAFLALVIEAFADEHLWQPALYYRWAFEDDARQVSRRIAETLLRDVRAPAVLKRLYIRQRQRWLYLNVEGSGRRQGRLIETDYLALLDVLERVFAKRDWLLGHAPTRADVGLFGPMFRHFMSDPTPSRILRERAPATAAWAARVWASETRRPKCARDLTVSASVAADLEPLMRIIAELFLPEAAINAVACAEGQRTVRWHRGEVMFRYRANPYRAWRLARLGQQFETLPVAARQRCVELLGPRAESILKRCGSLALPPVHTTSTRDRWWRRV